MKKFIYILSILSIGIFSSCNEDIPIEDIKPSFDVTFQLNPETVVEPFEYTRYYLERLDYASLRLRLFVYDEEGQLVASDEGLVDSYLNKTNITLNLKEGTYFAIVISNARDNDDGYEYWSFSGEQKLSTLTLTKNLKYLDRGSRNLLGVASKKINVSKKGEMHMMDLKPISAHFRIYYFNIHALDNINYDQFSFVTGKREKSVQFDNIGNPLFSFETTQSMSYYFTMDYILPNDFDEEDEYITTTLCMLPMKELNMMFWITQNGKNFTLSDVLSMSDIEAGEEYYAAIDLQPNSEGEYDVEYGRLKDVLEDNNSSPGVENTGIMHDVILRDGINFNNKTAIRIQNVIK